MGARLGMFTADYMYVSLYKAIVGLYNVQDIEVTRMFLCYHYMRWHVLKIWRLNLLKYQQRKKRSVQYLLTLQILLEMCSQREWTVVVSGSSV